MCVNLLQRLVFGIGIKPIVSDGLPYRDVVLLFNETVIVLAVRTATSEDKNVRIGIWCFSSGPWRVMCSFRYI